MSPPPELLERLLAEAEQHRGPVIWFFEPEPKPAPRRRLKRPTTPRPTIGGFAHDDAFTLGHALRRDTAAGVGTPAYRAWLAART